ncbi:MAG: LysR family transcriptional regulator [Lautropia sp.]|nr:LysR family transcriptional regulator [Lautropia sp.]
MISWDDMTLFVEVVKANGFRGAAERLGLPNSTVSRRISTLEKQLGLRLLNRTTRRIELTEEGHLYFERSRYLVEEAEAIHQELSSMTDSPCGTLRISVAEDLAKLMIAPHLPEFADTYPKLDFNFHLSDHHVDLVNERLDVAIRVGHLPDSPLIAYPLAAFTCSLYAAPSYLAQHGVPGSPEALSEHQCFARISGQTSWQLHHGNKSVQVPIHCRFTANSLSFTRHLATQGFGIIMVPQPLVSVELDAGTLVPVLPDWQGDALPIHALAATRLLPAKALRFIEFFREKLR